MNGQKSKKPNFQKVILKNIVQKPAVSFEEITSKNTPVDNYAFTRSMKNLVGAGYAEMHKSDHKNYLKITPSGKVRLNSMLLDGEEALVPQSWDGFWRIIILDLPEERKSERESLRYLLKKAGFVCLKNSAWISPFPYEYLFTNIKKDLGLTTEIVIFTTNHIDEISEKIFFENFKNQ